MSAVSWGFLVLAGLVATADWIAVQRGAKSLEYLCKPLTMVLLMGVAATVTVDDSSVRAWFLVALTWSMLGDVFLMVPANLFVAGLGSFLLAHVAYVIGLWVQGVSFLAFTIGVAAAALAITVIGGRVLRAVKAGEHAGLAIPVGAYMAVISAMLASAIGTRAPLAVGGAALFYCSDALIAWERFVRPRPWHRLAIIVTYHLAQAGLTLSLVS